VQGEAPAQQRELPQLRRDRAGDSVARQVKFVELSELAQLRRDGPNELIVVEGDGTHLSQPAERARNCAGQTIDSKQPKPWMCHTVHIECRVRAWKTRVGTCKAQ
jgi:hypothetical protein